MKYPAVNNEEESVVRLWRALLRVKFMVGGEIRPLFAERDLTGAQWAVLSALAHADPAGIMLSEISQELLVTGGNVTGLVDRLEEAGLVRRSAHPQDRRVVLAGLTPRGCEVYEQVAPEYQRRLSEALGGLSAERRQALTSALEQLAEEAAAARAGS
jgi:DNA-binding MarR family transcriptional regulator